MLHGAHEPGKFGGSLGLRVYLRFRVWGSTDSKGLWDLGIRRALLDVWGDGGAQKLRFWAILSTQKGTPGVPESVSSYPGTFENPILGTFDLEAEC